MSEVPIGTACFLKHRGLVLLEDDPKPMNKDCNVFMVGRMKPQQEEKKQAPSLAPILLFVVSSAIGKTFATKIIAHAKGCGSAIVLSPSITAQSVPLFINAPSRIDHLLFTEIAIDKPKSRLVPRYVQLNKEEIQALLLQRKIEMKNLSIMNRHDAIARYLGFVPGEVVHALESDTYRLVV